MGIDLTVNNMLVNLEKKDLNRLIRGSVVPYELFDHPLVKKAGHYYNGSIGTDGWNTNDLTEEELWDLYKLIEN